MKANTNNDDAYMRTVTALSKAAERFAKAYLKEGKQGHIINYSRKKIRDEAYGITRAAVARAVPEEETTP